MHMLPSPDAYRSIFRHPDGTYDWETEYAFFLFIPFFQVPNSVNEDVTSSSFAPPVSPLSARK